MSAVAVTLAILLLWLVQGLGFVQGLFPALRRHSLLGWVVAIWFGLIANLVILANVYYLFPGVAIGTVAWPLTLVLVLASAAIYLATPRAPLQIDPASAAVAIIAATATLLVLRPLLGNGELGFYSSNNGEFANYAAIADVVQFHGASAAIGGPLGMVSREAVVGLVAAVVAALSGKAALWVIQPLAAAAAAVAFASLGLLFRHAAARYRLGAAATAVLGLVYAWAVLSAAAQCFWTLSFVSQYFSVALFFGALVFGVEASEAVDIPHWRKVIALGLVFAALVCVYPEMAAPNLGMIGVFVVASADRTARSRLGALVSWLAAIAIAAVLVNYLGYQLVVARGGIGGSGWNIFGPHRPVLGYLNSIAGFTNPFGGPTVRSEIWGGATAVLCTLAISNAALRARTESTPGLRGLHVTGLALVAGVAALFWIVARRGLGNNYIATKVLLGFGGLGYLMIGLVLARWMQWRRWLAVPAAAALVAIHVGLATPDLQFTRLLHRASRDALFLESEGRYLRERLAGRTAYLTGTASYAIMGRFLIQDRDLFSAMHRWPDFLDPQLVPGQPMVVMGHGVAPVFDARVAGPYQARWRGIAVALWDRP